MVVSNVEPIIAFIGGVIIGVAVTKLYEVYQHGRKEKRDELGSTESE